MSQTLTQEIHVDELSKFGVKVGEEYVNYSKKLDEAQKGKLVPGGDYTVEMYVADSGKRYINSVQVQTAAAAPKKAKVSVAAPVTPKVTPKAAEPISNGLSKNEWAQKDRRISRQGLIQACLIALAPVVAEEVLFEKAEALANRALEFVNS